METPSFIKVKDTSYLFSGDGCFKFFVPEKYFTGKLANFVGEFIELFGIVPYAVYDKNDKPIGKLRNFKFPAYFVTKPDEIEIAKGLKLTKETKEQDYRILKYHKDGIIVLNYLISQNADIIDVWYSALTTGNILNVIPYNTLQDYFLDNIMISGNGYSVSLQMIGIVISELCRSSKDTDTPFRLSGSNNMNDYQMISVKDIPRGTSPFTAITSEEWDKAVVSSIMIKDPKYSPMEKVMMD